MGGVLAVLGRWRFLVAVVVSVLAFAGTAQAAPLFTSGADISAAGQEGFEPQVAVDGTGKVHAVWVRSDGSFLRIQYATRTPTGDWSAGVNISDAGQSASQPQIVIDPSNNLIVLWTRSDGTATRIQAAFKPSAGSFGAPVTVSDPGFDAFDPQLDVDNSGRAIVVWSRYDGANIRVQASIREAGVTGGFQPEVTISDFGQDADNPTTAAGQNVDANGVIVWSRLGAPGRVQSARRKDYVGYPRPLAATIARVPLVVAYDQCTGTGNRTHGPPWVFPSCNPPPKSSTVLTVGTNDANGFNANANNSIRWRSVTGNVATEANEADVQAIIKITDVRNNNPTGTDYIGRLGIRVDLKITDQRNAPEMPEAGTTSTFPLQFSTQCISTAITTIGASCNATTSLNALMPGAAVERRRAVWQLGQTTVRDAGANGTGYAVCPPTCGDGDEKTFLRQGIFVP
jgi:hypothetical protein